MNPPPLPQTISRDGEEIWSWAADFGRRVQRENRIRELCAEIAACGTACGDCAKWMHSRECPREKPGTGKRSGYSVGPSMGSPICQEYVETAWASERRTRAKTELETLVASRK